MQRKLTVIVSADVVSYAALIERVRAETRLTHASSRAN